MESLLKFKPPPPKDADNELVKTEDSEASNTKILTMIFPVLQTHGLDLVLNYCTSRSTCLDPKQKEQRGDIFLVLSNVHQLVALQPLMAPASFINLIVYMSCVAACKFFPQEIVFFCLRYGEFVETYSQNYKENTVYNAKKQALLGHCQLLLELPFLFPSDEKGWLVF